MVSFSRRPIAARPGPSKTAALTRSCTPYTSTGKESVAGEAAAVPSSQQRMEGWTGSPEPQVNSLTYALSIWTRPVTWPPQWGTPERIIATRDGGAHWTSRRSGVDWRLDAVFFLGDNLRGWAVGDAGRIIVTKDGGERWTPQQTPVASRLYCVWFESSGQRGWALGNGGLILSTENGGEQWNQTHLEGAGYLLDFTSSRQVRKVGSSVKKALFRRLRMADGHGRKQLQERGRA